jgi:hypothetical protein
VDFVEEHVFVSEMPTGILIVNPFPGDTVFACHETEFFFEKNLRLVRCSCQQTSRSFQNKPRPGGQCN